MGLVVIVELVEQSLWQILKPNWLSLKIQYGLIIWLSSNCWQNQALKFLISEARLTFAKLRQVFIKASIFHYLDQKYHIWFKTNISRYAIGRILNQLTLDNLGRQYLIIFFSKKMIPAKSKYKTYNYKLLAIVEGFKTWWHYLEYCKHEIFLIIDHNNLRHFMDRNSLSSKQVCQAQELSQYDFWIHYQ